MSDAISSWGWEIAVEQLGGVHYRMYRPREHRLESLLDHADRWAGRDHLCHPSVRGIEAVKREALLVFNVRNAQFVPA